MDLKPGNWVYIKFFLIALWTSNLLEYDLQCYLLALFKQLSASNVCYYKFPLVCFIFIGVYFHMP